MEVEEGHILADLSILEFYLHRSIQLRLGAFSKTDDDSRSELKQASLQTVIVSGTTKDDLRTIVLQMMYILDMINMLLNVLGGSFDDIPLDPVLRLRLNFGGVLGLLLFSGAESMEQRMEAMAKALPVLNQLGAASRCKTLLKPLFELRKIVLLWNSKNNIEAIEEFESVFGDSLSAEDLDIGKNALLNEEDFKKTRNEVLSDLNLKHFDRLVIEGMREAYQLVEAPLIAKMSKSQVSSMAASKDSIHEDVEESQCSPASMNLYTQAPYLTQIPTQDPSTQAYADTQSSMFPPSTADLAESRPSQQTAELSSQQPVEVSLPSTAIRTVDETVELPASSPAVLPPSTQESLPLSIEEEDSAPVNSLAPGDPEASVTDESGLKTQAVAAVSNDEEDISLDNGVITAEEDISIEKEIKMNVNENENEVKLEDKESQTGSFQPATQMPFDNDELELEEDSHPSYVVEEPILPTFSTGISTGISIQKDEPEECSAVDENSSESDEEEQFVNKVPFEFFSRLLKYCDEDPTKFFTTPEETIDRLYEKYERFKEERESDKVLPRLESLLPRESSPIRPVTKKRVMFESEADFEELPLPAVAQAAVRMPILKKAKKSMLLPNDSSKKVDWDSLTPSSPINENHARESPNSIEDEPARQNQKQAKGRRPFTEEETANLIDGVRKYGRKWAVILTCYKFNDRTSVDLKDKARNLARKGIINLPAVQNE